MTFCPLAFFGGQVFISLDMQHIHIHSIRIPLYFWVSGSLLSLSLLIVMLIPSAGPVSSKFLWSQACVDKGLSLYFSASCLLSIFKHLCQHRLLLEDPQVDLAIQTLFKLEKGPPQGLVPPCFLEKVLEV